MGLRDAEGWMGSQGSREQIAGPVGGRALSFKRKNSLQLNQPLLVP